MSRARSVFVLVLGALCLLVVAGTAAAQTQPGHPRAEPRDQIVLSGDVFVRRGQEVGEVVVLHGEVVVAGVARGDVIVVDGVIKVTGQVGGSVVNANGLIVLGPSSQVLGDVLAHGGVARSEGAKVGGDVREGVTFALGTPIRALGDHFAPWLAIWLSVLALGLLLIWLAPRGADATARAALGSPWPSAGWGVAAFVVLPLAGLVGLFTLALLPLGIGILLALFLLYSTGLAWSAFALGRLLWREPRGRVLSLLIGWAIVAAGAAIPFVDGVVWLAGSAFGLGACAIAIWRSRSGGGVRTSGGRHRAGVKMPAYASADPEPMVIEREMGEEGAGL
jgi:hypothetical protein